MKVKKNNKFNSIFKTLSEQERKEFCEFLRLSFVKKPRLSETITDMIESGRDLHSYLEKKYSDRSLWNIYSELTSSIKQFIAVKEIMDNETELDNLKKLQFHKRGLGDLMLKDNKKNIENLRSSEFSFYTLKEIQRSSQDCSLELTKKGFSKDLSEMLKMSSDHHVLSFYYELIFQMIEKELRKEFYGDNENFLIQDLDQLTDIRKVLKILTNKYPEYEIFFSINYNLYLSIKEPENLKYFKKTKELFLSNIDRIAPDLRSDIYYSLINVCTYISKKTKIDLNMELFEILRSKLENGSTDDLMSSKLGENHFRDYVYIALNLNEDKWAEEFISKFSPLLPENLRENNLNTALAFLNLKRKKYKDAIKYILNLKRKFFIHDFDYYTIQIFASYESDNILECVRIKKRFREYIKKNSHFPDSQKKGVENFLKLLAMLIKFKETRKKKLLVEIEQEMLLLKEVFWRNWLSKMIKNPD